MQQQWQEMQERVKALEGEVAKLKRLLLGALLFAGLPYLLAAKSAMQTLPVVRAERFEVVMDGKVVGTLTGGKVLSGKLKGRKGLVIYGENGKPVAMFLATPYGGALGISNKERKTVASLAATPDGGGSLGVAGKEGKGWFAWLGTTPNGGILSIANKEGKEIVRLGPNLDGGGALSVAGKEGKWVAGLSTTPDGGVLDIFNKEGKRVAGLGANPIGGGGLGIYNKEGKTVVGLGATPYGGLLDIANKEGKRIVGLGANLLGDGYLTLWSSTGLVTFSEPKLLQIPKPPPFSIFRIPAVPKVYAGVGGGHWVQKVMDNGTYILLEDGSLWEVAPLDRIDAALWLPFDDIIVVENIGLYPYKLINTSRGETVEAKYIGQK